MFTCSICDETFFGVHEDTAYTTICGHVFHYQCLIKWLNRSLTCPHCRSKVSKKDLIKLFLRVDPQARNVWSKKTEEEINSLNDQIKNAHAKENLHISSIKRLNSELQQLNNIYKENIVEISELRLLCHTNKNTIFDLQKHVDELIIGLTSLKDNNEKFDIQLMVESYKYRELEKSICELQSINTVAIDKLKSEIADLKSEKTYFENKYHSLKSGNDNLPNTSKVYFENKEDNLHKIQIKSGYYGHNPHLILSSKEFLFGCVFFFVEDKIDNYEDICNDSSMSKLNIIENRGRVEYYYSDRVTHLICVTQKDELVEQSIENGKRCVTYHWLNDVVAKRKMLPPWLAHHFPTPYSEKSGLPCQQYQIAIANFDANEYQIVKTMTELTGALVVNEVSSTTDVVVSLKLEGELVEKALAMKKPIVNVQWLNDVLFGAQIGLKYPTNMMYQNFDLNDPFSVNYNMVSHLMDAWKIPVVFLRNLEVIDLTDCPDSPVKHKRQKTGTKNSELINLVNDDCDDVATTYTSSNGNKSPPLVMFCGFSIIEEEKHKEKIQLLGGKIADNNKGTHLVMKEPIKTVKFLLCLSSVTYILNESWLLYSYSSSTFLNELDYCISDVYDESLCVVCNVPEILKIPTRKDLFKGMHFFVSPEIKSLPVISLQEIISSAGGVVEHQIKNSKSIQCLLPNTYIIACENMPVVPSLPSAVYTRPDIIIRSIMQQRTLRW